MAISSPFLPLLLHSASRIDIFQTPRFRRRFAFATTLSSSSSAAAEASGFNGYEQVRKSGVYEDEDETTEVYGVDEYFTCVKDLIRSDGGPPRWFSPLVNGRRRCADDAPLLLYLPGIDGAGLGLVKQQKRLAKYFHIWCFHIPVADRTPFTGLKNMVERTIRSESILVPGKPIYIVAECLGACLALAVAAHNPDIDLVLILVNPATSFDRSLLHSFTNLLELMPFEKSMYLQYAISQLQQAVLTNMLPAETLLWKLKMLKVASSYTNSRLHAVTAQTLILASGRDQLLPSQDEAERLCRTLSNCDIRRFHGNGHFLFLEDGVELLSIIKGASLYRRGRVHNFTSDYIPPSPSEFHTICSSYRWLETLVNPVVLSTLEDGKITRGLSGLPSEGPVLYVGYHMLLGLELVPLVSSILIERNIHVRGIAHPMMFNRMKEGLLPELSVFDTFRLMGAVPVSATNLYRLFDSKSHVLLYPGGMREALHRKGEEYKLFWPDRSEFVRMAARFGATIVPFGTVGEDDLCEVLVDYDDFVKIPFFKERIEHLTSEAPKLRTEATGEVSNQDVHVPGILPKLPGRFYYLFGKPIKTAGLQELKDREKSHELYLRVKSEVEACMTYLKEKRESDPYRNILPRVLYQATHSFTSQVPTFHIE